MRKIIALIAVVLGMSSCEYTPTKSTYSIDETMSVSALHFTSEDHHYILFCVGGKWAGVTHDPECWCMVDED